MPRGKRKQKTYKELEEEVEQLTASEKNVGDRLRTLTQERDKVDMEIDQMKRTLIDLKTERTIKIAEYDGKIRHKKTDLARAQKCRRSVVYELGKVTESHKRINSKLIKRRTELEERQKKFEEQMKRDNPPPIQVPPSLGGLSGLEIRDNNNGDGS